MEDFSDWFHRMLDENELIDIRYPVKGMPVYRGDGVRIIREMIRHLEALLEADGHEPMYFPVAIPETLLAAEAEHIAGFEDEVYWMTHAGGNPLDVKLALRPTSETCMYPMFALWTRTHTDLPIKIHQTTCVYRHDTKHTRPLIRSREIWWNEGHTAFETQEEALENIETVKRIYSSLITDLLCIPVEINQRPEWDKFPGAEYTIAFDTIFPDGKTLQVATIHNLGQHFSKVFNIEFENAAGEKKLAWQTSYGPGFGRLLASVVSVHGDEKGMRLPPKVAPIQAVIIPIVFKDSDKKNVMEFIGKVKNILEKNSVRFTVDDGDERPGAKYYKWEQRGVPLRLEVGPKDVEKKHVMTVRRDTSEKKPVKLADLDVPKVLDIIQKTLLAQAQEKFDARLFKAKDEKELDKHLGEGIVTTGWCGEDSCAPSIESKGTILSTDRERRRKCVVCGAEGMTIKVAKTY